MTVRDGFSRFPQGVVLIAAEIAGQAQGLVASAFTVGVSLEPPLVSVAVQRTSSTWPKLCGAERLGVSLLGRDHVPVAHQLGSSQNRERRFDGVDYSVDEDGALLLDASPTWLTVKFHDELPAGDHVIVLLEVLALGDRPEREATVMHRRAFHGLTELG